MSVDDIDLDTLSQFRVGDMQVEVFDPVADYADLMASMFDFTAMSQLVKTAGFSLRFDAMHAVNGPYAQEILVNRLGASPDSVINAVPLDDFGGGHPDPNLVHAHELVALTLGENGIDFGAA